MSHHTDESTGELPERGWRASRRVMLKAATAFAALAATGGAVQTGRSPARAQNTGTTLAKRWSEADEYGTIAAAEADEYRIVAAEFPFYAVGASWDGSFGAGAVLELSFSADGASYGASVTTAPALEDAGRPTRDGRIFVNLVFADGARFIRYRVLDPGGAPIVVPGLEITYIDATAGPSGDDVFAPAALPTLEQPPIVSRAGWGANESYRFDSYGEVWPPEYRKVEHVIIHHTATPNGQDPGTAIRSIYYYHAIDQGWGDIGYNFLVAPNGTIFEGRYGGPNVVGGHAYKYAYGSSGVGTLGTFSLVDVSDNAQAALVAISAWVGRNLPPLGTKTFHEAPNLPTICGHRDVSQSECPGDQLWGDLPGIRNAVADLLGETESPSDDPVPPFPPDTYKTGDNVITDRQLYLRTLPSQSSAWLTRLPAGTYCAIYGLPRIVDGEVWYYVLTEGPDGYLLGRYLDPAPPGNTPAPIFQIGDRVRLTQNVSMRRDPGLPQTQTGALFSGAVVQITAGPVAATGYLWWGVYDPSTTGGWVIQEVLADAGLPKLHLSRQSSIPGITIGFDVEDFPPNTSVAIQWDGSIKLRVTTNGSGNASGQYKIPSAVKGGHIFRAVAGSNNATAAFEVLSTITFSPKEGPTGTPLTIVCRGYAAGEDIEIQWQDGNEWVPIKSKTTGASGSMKTQITVPVWASGQTNIRGHAPSGDAQRGFTVTGGPVPVADPDLHLSRPSGIPGITVGYDVTGFPADTSVDIRWDGDTVDRVTTDGNGEASGEYKIPSAVKGGHTFEAVAGSLSATAPFEVLPTITFAPKEAPTGTPLIIVCRGFAAGEDIEIQWQQGEDWAPIKSKTSSTRGSIKTQITVPVWASGPSAIRGHAPSGDAQRSFLVTPPDSAEAETPTPQPTATPQPTTDASATPDPTATATPEPTETPTPEPTPTETPTETPTPEPTPEPTETPAE